ncbi:hypothetical protein [Streptomyces sp. SID3343]|uniref:hypothetical protein n=1 Tax=Streptomyces sp. SID3343 TaxID=2690260 RepID=UPI0013684940|nr:hypothetical protein [Streptomyces sp. SID3343]MYW00205.1 hypothetical protein [Streptomyces sp. SID3343]
MFLDEKFQALLTEYLKANGWADQADKIVDIGAVGLTLGPWKSRVDVYPIEGLVQVTSPIPMTLSDMAQRGSQDANLVWDDLRDNLPGFISGPAIRPDVMASNHYCFTGLLTKDTAKHRSQFDKSMCHFLDRRHAIHEKLGV